MKLIHSFIGIAIILVLQSCGDSSGKLYMRTMTYWGGSSLEISWLYFADDETLVRNPKFGINPIDLKKEKAENANNVATYKKNGDKMDLVWGDGRTQSVNVEYKDGDLSAFDGGLCSPAKSYSISSFNNLRYSGLATAGPVSRSMVIDFREDGTFSMNSLGAIGGEGNVVGSAASENKRTGKYTIKGNSIDFLFDDGTVWNTLSQPYDLGKQDIIINDQLFKVEN